MRTDLNLDFAISCRLSLFVLLFAYLLKVYLPMCICLPERLQTDIWVWEAMVLDLPINQVLKDAVLGSAGHLTCAHKYKYTVLV